MLISFILHAGLTPTVITALQDSDFDPAGWVRSESGWQPLPDRTLAEIRTWQVICTGNPRSIPHWTRLQLDQQLAEISGVSGVTFTVELAHAALARALLRATEDGKWLQAILGAQAEYAEMPLDTIFPFSISNFEPRDDELAQRARGAQSRRRLSIDCALGRRDHGL